MINFIFYCKKYIIRKNSLMVEYNLAKVNVEGSNPFFFDLENLQAIPFLRALKLDPAQMTLATAISPL